MLDEDRLKILMDAAKAMDLKPKLLSVHGLIALQINGKERYVFYDDSSPNTQLAGRLSANKHTSRTIFERHGLPNIPYCLAEDQTEAEAFLAKHKLIVAKPLRGQHSKNIQLIDKPEQLEGLDFERLIFEKFIKGQEVRYLVLNGDVIAAHHKIYPGPINDPETVKRVSLQKKDWDKELSRISIEAAEAIGLRFTAIDFIVESGGRAYILEINSAPGLLRFEMPTEGPPIEAARIFLEEIIKNYKQLDK